VGDDAGTIILTLRTVVKGPEILVNKSLDHLHTNSASTELKTLSTTTFVTIMSDLPELPLFEEIKDISNSSDFFTYTQDEFNKAWSYYEDETTADSKTSGCR